MKNADRSEKQRPASTDRITVTLGPGQREFLEALAERNNTTLAFVVRHVIAKFIKDHKDEQLRLELPER
jgi:hypothetical protein